MALRAHAAAPGSKRSTEFPWRSPYAGDGLPPRLEHPVEILQRINSSQGPDPVFVSPPDFSDRQDRHLWAGGIECVGGSALPVFPRKVANQPNGASFIDPAYFDASRRFLDDTQAPILGYWGRLSWNAVRHSVGCGAKPRRMTRRIEALHVQFTAACRLARGPITHSDRF